MKNNTLKICLLLAVFLMLPSFASAAVLFETNFDSIPDWNTGGQYNGDCGNWSGGVNHCTTAPTGFDNHYTPSGGYISALPDGQGDKTGSGKAFMPVYPNAVYSGGSQIEKTFSSDYLELYTQFWARTTKTAPLWYQGTSGASTNESAVKFFRVSHFDRTESAFQYFSGGYSGPIALINWAADNAYAWQTNHSLMRVVYRCDPQETNYYCAGTYADTVPAGSASGATRPRDTDYPYFMATPSPNSAGGFADGNWHRYDMRVKMNTGTSANGVLQIWYDGTLVHDDNTVQWCAVAGGQGCNGWNTVELGGNADNTGGSFSSQWIAYDNLVASTTAIPANYAIGGGSVDTTAPSTPTGLSVI